MESNTYVYTHTRLDTNEVFYIGIGINSVSYKVPFKRAYSDKYRSEFWKSVSVKHGYAVEILFSNLTRLQACEKERELIKFYGRKDLSTGTLVNMTDGGDGLSGHKFTDDHKRKIGEKHKGKIVSDVSKLKMSEAAKNKTISDTHKKNISKALMGNKYSLGFKHTQETKDKVSAAGKGRQPMLGKKHSDATKLKISEAAKGRIFTQEHKDKIGAYRKGKPGTNIGIKLGPMSEERKKNISNALKLSHARRNEIFRSAN